MWDKNKGGGAMMTELNIVKGHCCKILNVALRQTKTGRKIKMITAENVPYQIEIWDNDPVFNEPEPQRYLCVIEGLLYEKRTEGYDPVISVKKDTVLRVSQTPIGRVYTANPQPAEQPKPEPQIPKTFAAEIKKPESEPSSALLTILDEIKREIGLLRRVLEERLDFKQPKIEDVVKGD